MKPSHKRLLLLVVVLVSCLLALAYLRRSGVGHAPLREPDPGEEGEVAFRFKVPMNSRVSLLWEDEGSGETKKIGLKADPGAQLKVSIEPGDPAIPGLDELPEGFFFEVPADGASAGTEAEQLSSGLRLVAFENQPINQSRFRFYWETYDHPVLTALRSQEKLDEVVDGAASELEFFSRLLKWTHEQLTPGQPDPYPPWNAMVILDWVRSGRTKAFCAQYAQVMAQALLSFGHQVRYVSLANHEVLEVWSNELNKWVTMDPSDGLYYTDGKTPLNSYELYQALKEGDAAKVKTAGAAHKTGRLESYGVFIISTRNDHLSQNRPPSAYLNDMWKERIHLITPDAEGLPYHEGKLRPITPFVSDLYFPMNTAHVHLLAPDRDGNVIIGLKTDMPGFERFTASEDGGASRTIGSLHTWKLRDGRNEIRIQAQNTKGIKGPVTRIVVEKAEAE